LGREIQSNSEKIITRDYNVTVEQTRLAKMGTAWDKLTEMLRALEQDFDDYDSIPLDVEMHNEARNEWEARSEIVECSKIRTGKAH
jgi:hypothetical protein